MHRGGEHSFEDWPQLTWSLGCTGSFEPSSPPSISMARLAITSLAFMLDWVPEPVCHTDQRELVVELAGDDFLRRGNDGVGERRVEQAQRAVGFGRGFFDDAERADQRQRHAFAADLEIAKAALRLRAPIMIHGDFDGAEVSVSMRVAGGV